MDIRIQADNAVPARSSGVGGQAPYSTVLRATLHRLAANVRDAFEDGNWAAAESAQLHAWVRAELLPWAADQLRTLDVAARVTAAPLFAELAALDAELLGTAGYTAAEISGEIRKAGTRLLALCHEGGTAARNSGDINAGW